MHVTNLTFPTIQDVAEYTRTAPPQRIKTLLRFSKRFSDCKDVTDNFKTWGMEFSPQLEKIETARVLKPEPIFFSQKKQFSYQEDNADWNPAFRKNHLFEVTPCSNWGVIFDDRSKSEANAMVGDLKKAAAGMGFMLGNPRDTKSLANANQQTYVQGIVEMK